MRKIFVIFFVINVIGNFCIKAFSLMYEVELNRNCITTVPTVKFNESIRLIVRIN